MAQGDVVATLVLFGTSSPNSRALAHRLRTLPIRVFRSGLRLYRERLLGVPGQPASPNDPNRVRVENATTIAARRYTAPDPYPGRIVLFRPSDSRRGLIIERYLEWEKWAEGGLVVHAGPPGGVHGTMLLEPNVRCVMYWFRPQ